ncbi:hypothetical protein [Thiosocius teredinicola]|uniref:hypothetical protein n=1 Tax=Thiosocius teredinicola TaxID=1973002 RepID=UPI0009910592
MLDTASVNTIATSAKTDRFALLDWSFLAGLMLLSLQVVSAGPAQTGHLWASAMLAYLILQRRVTATPIELGIFLAFFTVALINTVMVDVHRIKDEFQILKFAVVYPAFFIVGRFYGQYYFKRRLPLGVWFIAGFVVVQWLIQHFQLPVIHQPLQFQEGSLHGTFRERNWFAVMLFFMAYIVMLKTPSRMLSAIEFLAICVLVTLLSGSKSVLVAGGIALLFAFRGHLTLKVLGVIVGGAIFIELFAWQLSGDLLRVRLEDERGLAAVLSWDLIQRDWLGYGFGFVEAHFGGWWISVQGLGYGVASVFSAPIDFLLIAGPFGVLFWLVFFAGVGLGWRAVLILAPVASWSLINPMHQSEIVYLMLGYLVAWARLQQAQATVTATTPVGVQTDSHDAATAAGCRS